MRSATATDLIIRKESIQHESAFVAAIRSAGAQLPALLCPRCGESNVRKLSTAGHFTCNGKECGNFFSWFDLGQSTVIQSRVRKPKQ